MSFFNTLFSKAEEPSSNNKNNNLYEELKVILPNYNDEELMKISCVCALMGRVAFADAKIDEDEKKFIESALEKWFDYKIGEAKAITELCVQYIRELGTFESHLIIEKIRKYYNQSERYNLTKILFHVASADKNVDSSEVEDIRIISKSFGLSHKHFISAKAEVLEYLAALKK